MLPSGYSLVYEKLKKRLDYGELLPGDALKPEKELDCVHTIESMVIAKRIKPANMISSLS